jgi:hypothetical protein
LAVCLGTESGSKATREELLLVLESLSLKSLSINSKKWTSAN